MFSETRKLHENAFPDQVASGMSKREYATVMMVQGMLANPDCNMDRLDIVEEAIKISHLLWDRLS